MTVTELRKNIFKVFDEVQRTGKPIEVSRKGEKFLLKPLSSKKSKLSHLKKEGIIKGDSDDLAEIKVWDINEWIEPDILDGKQ
ncbi:type II toxin-antitoxin system prevent-host-death family antitoxin [Ekhidna sp.]|uniref:type II toxin-antitoxin system prevent-host-death family antitoxin n=1 Tax=Ekhidna sp. TaxID=2608089 RepID=UPI003CCB8CA9